MTLKEDKSSFLEIFSTGGSLGDAIGFSGGAVVGSVIGTSIGHALKNIGDEISRRFLSLRETIRIGAVIIFASNNIEKYSERT